MVNALKITWPSHAWAEPDVFRSDRFLTSHKDVVHLILARFLRCFKGVKEPNDDVDMTDSSGHTNQSTKLDVFVTPRQSLRLYMHLSFAGYFSP